MTSRLLLLLGLLTLVGCTAMAPDSESADSASRDSDNSMTDETQENPVRVVGGTPVDGGSSSNDDVMDEPTDDASGDMTVADDDPEMMELPVDEEPVEEEIDDEEPVEEDPIFDDVPTLTELGLVDRWGFPIYDQTGMFRLLDLAIDGLSFGILPDPSGNQDALNRSRLEAQCVAQGEPEFICRQRYGY